MAKIFNSEVYLSPMEASQQLGISYKTLQRWAESGNLPIKEAKEWKQQKINIELVKTRTGHRYYSKKIY